MGLIGPGFVAAHHIDAVRRLGDVDVVAIAGSSQASADKKAQEYKVERAYGDFHALIADPDVQVIHNTTPNYLHLPVTMAALAAGKHVISDKPLAMNPEEGRKMRDAAVAAKVAHVVTFNYRGNPLVQQARGMIARGETGGVSFVHGSLSSGLDDRPERLLMEVRSGEGRGDFRAWRHRFALVRSRRACLRVEDRVGTGRSHDRHPSALFLRRFRRGFLDQERRRANAGEGAIGRPGQRPAAI